jgi:hypothetical protein
MSSLNLMWFLAGAVTVLIPAIIVFGITGRSIDARRSKKQRFPPELGGRRHDDRLST